MRELFAWYDICMKTDEPKSFSLPDRVRSSNHALRGIGIFIRHTHNAWLHVFFAVAAAYVGYVLAISPTEWALVVIAIMSVFVTEALNTAIEIHMDLTSPEFHPHARDTKDVAAGAVLLSVMFAGIVGCIVFVPKIIALYR